MYSCASSIKATIRTVDFVYNGTTFDALNATSARPKRYAGPSEWPLWGVEDMGDFGIVDAQPLWGVLGPSNTTIGDMKSLKTNISTVSRESIQLPGAVNDISYLIRGIHPVSDKVGQNLPGVDFYTQALSNAFNIGRPSKIAYGDYSGQTQLALFAKWQELSRTADRVSKIVNLVWTDIAANSVVGTKGWGLASAVAGGSADQDSTVPIVSYRKRVRFYIPYAVPGFVVLPITLVVLVASIVMLVMRRTGIQKLRELLNATSSGRIISLYEWPEEARGLTTGDWVEKMGGRPVVVSTESIIAGEDKANEDEQRHAEMPSSNEKSRSATM